MLVGYRGLLCWTYEQIGPMNVFLEWNSFVCGELNCIIKPQYFICDMDQIYVVFKIRGFGNSNITRNEYCIHLFQIHALKISTLRTTRFF